ncbi:MAG: nitrogenase component 1 [Lachnospiraceae bacterium]|nr:nitrogenase component 1 [Lachnospiraceae bacterium]
MEKGPANHAFRKYLTPFAPDQSGAVGVLFELGGIQVICDAGGCVGNICGFDEPRWFKTRSSIFSAGLRDMDAILGRDDQLVAKLAYAVNEIQPAFAAVIGTPVPAVIATDYHALKRMAERKTKLPILSVETNGMDLYDEGEKKAYLELFATFAEDTDEVEKGRLGVIGMTPLNFSDTRTGSGIKNILEGSGAWKTVDTYGMGCGLDRVKTAGKAEKNLVVAPSGLAAAEYLKKRFGTPYEFADPNVLFDYLRAYGSLYKQDAKARSGEETPEGKKILVVAQQVTGVSMRKLLFEEGAKQVQVGTFFMKLPELSEEGDLHFNGERQFAEAVARGDYDWIIADEILKPLVPDYKGCWLDLPHFAVSGRMINDHYQPVPDDQ